jgi:hypothetical protein
MAKEKWKRIESNGSSIKVICFNSLVEIISSTLNIMFHSLYFNCLSTATKEGSSREKPRTVSHNSASNLLYNALFRTSWKGEWGKGSLKLRYRASE